jgi:diguanylate cyclase (GGDEF)-like protein
MALQKQLIIAVSRDIRIFEELASSLSKKFDIMCFNSYESARDSVIDSNPVMIIAETTIGTTDGTDFFKIIKKGKKTKLIPFIFIADKDDPEKKIEAIQSGADAYLSRPVNLEELKAHISAKVSVFTELYTLSSTDELTNLYNRREFTKMFNAETAKNASAVISVSIIDLDFFKQVNDLHGHQTGDIVLMEFAKLLKKFSKKEIFPIRFGGEEFLLLFINTTALVAKEITDKIRESLHLQSFKSPIGRNFHVSFSAGVAEFPETGKNLSILLSRADQALYAAKKDGRGRTHIFTPAMGRNDRFWAYLKKRKGLFYERDGFDPSTSLPFLSYALESLLSEELTHYCGVIILKFIPFMKVKEHLGITTHDLCIENIKDIITKSCEQHFASDTSITVSDPVDKEITILFPLYVDIPLNSVRCDELYKNIVSDINQNTVSFPFFISYASGIVKIDHNNPRAILHDIKMIRMRCTPIGNKRDYYYFLLDSFSKTIKYNPENLLSLLRIDFFRSHTDNEIKGISIVPANDNFSFIPLYHILVESSYSYSSISTLFTKIKTLVDDYKNYPLFLPYIPVCDLAEYITNVSEHFKNLNVVILLNETLISTENSSIIETISSTLPANISLGIDNCAIGKLMISVIAKGNISLIILSEYLTRDIHLFKDRIKIVNGFNIYLEQLGIPLAAKNIRREEEMQIITDLNFSLSSGYYKV